jgi:ATP-dependent helicase/nuclease subunit B
MRAALPAFTEAVERALQTFERGSRRRFPAEWIVAWERCLQGLGWQPEALGSPPGVLAAWSGASESFASLSAILGTLSATEALAQFRRLLDATSVGRPMPREGVHVVEHADQLGAGYAGIWMTGFTDRLWPATVRLNPLLPLWLQKDHQMPYSTPAIADLASRRILSRVLACAPEIVVSSPALVDDTEFLPSRILDDFEPTDYSDAGSGIRRSYCHSRISERRRTRVKERVPPMQPAEIAGVRALELQSACPLRAFCEIRLRAVPLEVPQRGISRRLRGIIVHRALQLLFSPHVGADTIDVGRLESRAAAAARRAVADAVDQDYPPWDLVAALESARTERAIAALLAWEARRAPFQVVDVERPVQLRIDGWSLKGRLDRVDRLEDGSLVIVDYKTGTLPASAGWFSDRLRFPQMPAYTLSLGDALRAFLVVAVDDGAVEFRAAGSLPEDFPARARPSLSGADWSTQRLRWRTQIAGLLEEFGAGDGRVFVADTTLAEGPYAMLTRVHGPGTDDEAAGRG